MLAVGIALSGATGGCIVQEEPAVDEAGHTEDARQLPLEEQYRLAGEHYADFQELVAETQRTLSEEERRRGPSGADTTPLNGAWFTAELPGATEENSYYFKVYRDLFVEDDQRTLLREVKRNWEGRGLRTGEYEAGDRGLLRVTGTGSGGLRFVLGEMPERIELTAHSAIYWGDYRALRDAVLDRRTAEAGQEIWAPRVDDEGYYWLEPGDYRPFPEWDAAE